MIMIAGSRDRGIEGSRDGAMNKKCSTGGCPSTLKKKSLLLSFDFKSKAKPFGTTSTSTVVAPLNVRHGPKFLAAFKHPRAWEGTVHFL